MLYTPVYHTVENFSDKKTLANLAKYVQQSPSFLPSLTISTAYGFTNVCYPSMVRRVLGLPLLMLRLTHTWFHMASCLGL